ncbi:MAG: hypothetical protein WCG35_10805 [Betaproteobacteria bacterium]
MPHPTKKTRLPSCRPETARQAHKPKRRHDGNGQNDYTLKPPTLPTPPNPNAKINLKTLPPD